VAAQCLPHEAIKQDGTAVDMVVVVVMVVAVVVVVVVAVIVALGAPRPHEDAAPTVGHQLDDGAVRDAVLVEDGMVDERLAGECAELVG
jgi:hypothetical protein